MRWKKDQGCRQTCSIVLQSQNVSKKIKLRSALRMIGCIRKTELTTDARCLVYIVLLVHLPIARRKLRLQLHRVDRDRQKQTFQIPGARPP